MFVRPSPAVTTTTPGSQANNASVLLQDRARTEDRGGQGNVDNGNSDNNSSISNSNMEPPARMVDKRRGGVVADVTGGQESVGTSSDTAVDVRMPVAVVADSMMDGAMELEPSALSLSAAKQVCKDMLQRSSHTSQLFF